MRPLNSKEHEASIGAGARNGARSGAVVMIFNRIGPYHVARLRAAGALGGVIGVELYGMDETYGWERVERSNGFHRVTLFESESTKPHRKLIAQQIERTLNFILPKAVFIPGWSAIEALTALEWCVRSRTPTVVISESTVWDDRRTAWKEATKRKIMRLISAGLVGGTPHADYLVRLGMPRENIFLGYDVVDNEHFAKGADEARMCTSELRSKHSLPPQYFLASGRFVKKKNLVRLLTAYARYRRQAGDSAWGLVLLGDGPDRVEVLHTIRTLEIDEAVLLSGFQQYEQLPLYYGLASVFVHASTSEQWGLVVNEAMAAGLPILVSERCGCAADLIKSGVNGFQFDPYNIQQLADLMLLVSGDQVARESMAKTSRDMISAWSPTQFATNLWKAVDTAMSCTRQYRNFVNRALLWALTHR